MLLDHHGQPIQTFRKADPPKMGPAYGHWANRDPIMMQLPGSQVLQFDLSALTDADYRIMRTHPQINASLAVLTFMVHQIDWHVECEDQRIADAIEENIRDMWTRMIRAFSQAFWAGRSPIVLEYENHPVTGRTEITKFKDLFPEDCVVNWKEVEGWSPPGYLPPKYYVYDGIKQAGLQWPIPAENTVWYPLMMENGNYDGRKLLQSAFVPWFFSTIMHLFANRYYERFGEPVPVGRYPTDTEVDVDGEMMPSKNAMDLILTQLRNRSVVSLPSDRDPVTREFDYIIEYLESNMRGIDFERYLTRLDEEISLAIFTPILMFKTGAVGSNNLGVQHTQTFMWLLNALIGDMREYIEHYVFNRLRNYNFSERAPRPFFRWKPLGKENVETIRAIISELIRQGKASVDLEELGQYVGMTVKQVREVTAPQAPELSNQPGTDNREVRDKPSDERRGVGEPRATGRQIMNRAAAQVTAAFQAGRVDDLRLDFGHQRRMYQAFRAEGYSQEEARQATDVLYDRLDRAAEDLVSIHSSFSGPQDFMAMLERHLDNALDAIS